MDIKKLKETVNVQDLLENYEFEQITDDGEWVKARCPYHDDSNPSFCVRKSDTYFHCWSCKESGDAIRLIMDLDKVDFKEATTKLAALCGYSENSDANMEYLKNTWLDKREKPVNEAIPPVESGRVLELNRWATGVFSKISKEAVRYLHSRDIALGLIRKYGLGSYPDNFIERAEQRGYSKDDLRKSGFLVGDSDYEIFKDRLMFPICDLKGRARAFSGRTLTDQEPKYIATPNSDYYKKSYFLFGIQNISNKRPIVVVEGNIDCVRLGMNDFNAVAQLGSALTFQQCELLSQVYPVVILLMDGDEAGRKATYKAIPRLAKYGINIYVVELPEGLDPDSYVVQKGPEELRNLIKKTSERGLKYHVRHSSKSEAEILCDWLKIINSMESVSGKQYYMQLLSATLNVSTSVIETELKKVGA